MFVWRKSFYPSYFPFNIVKVSVKIRDLRAHFALTGQTHSRAALARWVIWYPTLIPVSARFCSAMINVTKSHIQHREAQQSGQEIGQWEACFLVKLPIRGQMFPCHTWPVEVVMTWSCDERFMTCIHDTISCVSDWLKDCFTDLWLASFHLATNHERIWFYWHSFPGSRPLTFLHASEPGPVTTW